MIKFHFVISIYYRIFAVLTEEWREKAEKNKGIFIAIAAFLHGNTLEEERNRILHLNEYREVHSLGLKLMEDMVNV